MGADPTVAVIIAVLGALALVMAPIGAGLITRGGRSVLTDEAESAADLGRLRDDLGRLRDTVSELRSDLADEREHVADERRRHAQTALERDEMRAVIDAMTKGQA